MSVTSQLVEIDSHTFEAYSDVAGSDRYLAGESWATAWRAGTETEKSRWVVSATRILNRQPWAGEKADEDQELAWPRTGIDGVDQYSIPNDVADANSELAGRIADGFNPVQAETDSRIKRQKAGSVEQEFFRADDGQAGAIPSPVLALIARYLGGAATGIAGSWAAGTCGRSITECPSYDMAGHYGILGGNRDCE